MCSLRSHYQTRPQLSVGRVRPRRTSSRFPRLFILGEQLDADEPGTAAFARYRTYLDDNRGRFPPSAHALASAEWYHDFSDHRCPHDAWLEAITIEETGTGVRGEQRAVAIRVRLLGAYHDGHIEFYYRDVMNYRLEGTDVTSGHSDWRYDEFRLGDQGQLIHEIEWVNQGETARWIIEAVDVAYSWRPFSAASPQVGAV